MGPIRFTETSIINTNLRRLISQKTEDLIFRLSHPSHKSSLIQVIKFQNLVATYQIQSFIIHEVYFIAASNSVSHT
jgi:hypothetical protein